MIRYIALLRGINVSGQRLIRMEDLRPQFVALGFHCVSTYIQSGNVWFETSETPVDALATLIEKHLLSWLGYPVTVVVRTQAALADLLAHDPFGDTYPETDFKRYVAFLTNEPDSERQRACLAFQHADEIFSIRNCDVYISIRKETLAKLLFSNNWLEKKLGVQATTRNWATVNKLALSR